jgi:hypothetical protein
MDKFNNEPVTRSSVGSLKIQILGSCSELRDLKKIKGKYLYVN